jgi:hypothetical protein
MPHHYSELRTPLFTIERSRVQPRIILTHDDDACGVAQPGYGYYRYMCKNPSLRNELKLIWDKAEIIHQHRTGLGLSSEKCIGWQPGLESLWAAASILDQCDTDTEIDLSSSSAELTQYSFPEIVVEYNHKCGCCAII